MHASVMGNSETQTSIFHIAVHPRNKLTHFLQTTQLFYGLKNNVWIFLRVIQCFLASFNIGEPCLVFLC